MLDSFLDDLTTDPYHDIWSMMGNPKFLEFIPTGSREICDPPPMDTDYDIVCLVESLSSIYDNNPVLLSWSMNSNIEVYDIEDASFIAFRKGEINLILVDDPVFFKKWKIATDIARHNPVFYEKDIRIAMFAVIFSKDIQ